MTQEVNETPAINDEVVEQLIEQATAQQNAEIAEAEAKFKAVQDQIIASLGDTPVDFGIPALLEIALGSIGRSYEQEDKKHVFGFVINRVFEAIAANGIDVADLFQPAQQAPTETTQNTSELV